MRNYCKAYKLADVRKFPGWTEKPQADGQALPDDNLCFIWDDFTVTSGVFDGEETGYLFDQVTPEWQEFCKNELNFEVPPDVIQAAQEA